MGGVLLTRRGISVRLTELGGPICDISHGGGKSVDCAKRLVLSHIVKHIVAVKHIVIWFGLVGFSFNASLEP